MLVIGIRVEVDDSALPPHGIADLELPTFRRRPPCSGLQILQPGVERDVDLHSLLDRPSQFPTYVRPHDG